MKTVDEMIDDILQREDRRYKPGSDPNATGWAINVAGDRGGATALGMTIRYMRGIGLDLDGDGDVDEADVELVTPALAHKYFRRDFLEEPKIDQLPAELHPQLFDIGVLSGPFRAVELLQRVISNLGRPIDEDGRMGKQTLAAAEAVITTYGTRIVNNHLVNERIGFFRRVVARDPEQSKFLRGWINRAEEFRV